MQDDGCLIMPSASQFKKTKQKLGIKSGQSYDMFIPQPFLRGDNTNARVKVDFEEIGWDCWFTQGGGEGVGVSYMGGDARVVAEWG